MSGRLDTWFADGKKIHKNLLANSHAFIYAFAKKRQKNIVAIIFVPPREKYKYTSLVKRFRYSATKNNNS